MAKIGDLEPGRRFRQGDEEPYRFGKLLRVSVGSATVQYESRKVKHIEVRRGREVVRTASFKAPMRPVAISLETEVTPVEELPAVDATYAN